MTLESLFGHGPNLYWWQECARAAVIFVYGLVLVRVAGRRAFGKWSALDIVVSIIIGSNLSRALTGSAELWGTLAATTLLMLLHWVCAQAAARSSRASRILEGHPIPLGSNGRVDDHGLVRHGVSQADLAEALRSAGLDDPRGAREIVLEPSGKLVLLRSGNEGK